MIQFSVNEIAEVTGGRLRGDAERVFVQGVSTDNRTVKDDDLFIAIRGETHDGHAFLAAAVEAGAGALMVSDEAAIPATVDAPAVIVGDTRAAMGRLAAAVRARAGVKLAAVTGSNGKTTTKDLIAHVLGGSLKIVSAPKSFNNDIGVPLTLFQLTGGEDAAVLELGTNHPGEIDALANICKPDIAVLTGIGRAHLEAFGTLDGVAREKGALLNHVRDGGAAFVNGDDPHCRRLADEAGCKVFRYGFGEDNDIRAADVTALATGLAFVWNGHTLIRMPLLGRHNVYNALAAIGVAQRCGITPEDIALRLATAKAPDMRLRVERAGDRVVLNDAYNANPDSMAAALRTLADTAKGFRSVAVLGEMYELGADAEACHAELGRVAAEAGVSAIIAVGRYAQATVDAAGGVGERHACADRAAALEVLRAVAAPGSVVLFKGSRKSKLEDLLHSWKETLS